ncbi:MAG: efflux RND transporter periplasmic adaptor subunit [Thauera sp.]|nr:efflux RND transporter periplasmic adaptor subunit [Thauera sp.]
MAFPIRLSPFVLLCLVVLLLASASRFAPGVSVLAPAHAQADAGAKAVLVEAVEVQAQALNDEVSAVGSLISNESVLLRPEVAGRIVRIGFADGEEVAAGSLLFELDAAVQQAELAQAEASVRLAKANHVRNVDLLARKFVSQSTVDNSRAELEVARAGRSLAAARLARTRIHAPFAGVLGLRQVSPGDYVREGDALVNLEDISRLKLDFRLPELRLDQLRRGQMVELSTDVLPGEVFQARVEAIDPQVDAQGRAVRLRASVDNAQRRLRPGVFARVRLILAEQPAALMLPEEALVPAPGNLLYVYQIVDGIARRVEVEAGSRRGTQVEIRRGLAPGALVVTAGQLKLRDGDAVELLRPVAAAQD